MRESQIENRLIKELKKLGIETRKVQWIGRDGAPDRLILANGGIWVELKAPGEKPRLNQVIEHKKMRAAGMRVEIIDSIQQIDELIGSIHGNTSGV